MHDDWMEAWLAMMAGAQEFPCEAAMPGGMTRPMTPEIRAALRRVEKPFLARRGAKDIVAPGGNELLQREIPGTKGQPHDVPSEPGHLIPEDAPEEVALRILAFVARTL